MNCLATGHRVHREVIIILIAIFIYPYLQPVWAKEGEKGVKPDIESIDTSTVAAPFSWHGRADLSLIHFSNRKNVDKYSKGFFRPLAPVLFLRYEFSESLSASAEVGYEGDEGGIEMDQIALDWRPLKEFLKIRLGNSYFPFGIERMSYAPSSNKLVDRPSPFRRIIPGTYSDIGLFLSGSFFSDRGFGLKYELAISNGLKGPERSGRQEVGDNNDNKNVGGRLGLVPMPGLELGFSYAVQEYDKHQRYQLDFWGTDFSLNKTISSGELDIRGEYLMSHVEQSKARGGNYSRYGWYIQTVYKHLYNKKWLEYLEYVLRYDSLDDNSNVRNYRDVRRWAMGVNWSPIKNLCFKTGYEINDERSHEIPNNGFFCQLEYHW